MTGIHTGVSDFRNIRKEKQGRKQKHKDGDGKIDPLDVFQRAGVTKVEEDVRAQNWGNDSPDAIESLGNIDSDLGVSWGPAN